MQFAIFASLALPLLAAAQTATGTPSSDKCQAQNIVDVCVQGYQDRIDACNKNSNDWVCLCNVYTDVLTCYNNCPNSNEKPPVQNQVTQYCQAAAPIISASLASAATAGTKSAAQATSAATTTGGASPASSTASTTTTGSGTFNTGAAQAIAVPVGGVLAMVLGVAGLL